MRSTRGSVAVLITAAALTSAGWGAVLPYIYGDIDRARGLGSGVAALTFTAIALGTLLAAPISGRVVDRRQPGRVAVVAELALAAAVLALGLAGTAPTVLAAALLVGAALAFSQPAFQVLLLARTAERERRTVFAWQFIGTNLGLAAGGFAGGQLVDLSSAAGTRPIYYLATAGALASSLVVGLATRGLATAEPPEPVTGERGGYRDLLRLRPVRWLLGVTVLITLACYAQYESGLPAYTLDAVHISPHVLGTAVAINAILVAALTAPVVAATRRFAPTTLLGACALVWIGCWALLGLPLLHHSIATLAVLGGYALFSVGETMFAPVLSPLAASLAPTGGVGRTLAAVTGATTAATAVGPAVAGLLLAIHLPSGFIALQLACCVGALLVARRLGRLTASHRAPVDVADSIVSSPAVAG